MIWGFISYLFLLVQFERGEALDNIAQEAKRTLEEECDTESLTVLSKVVDRVRKGVSCAHK
jgi:polyribonucleotide nucleotidyltransferase